MEDRENMGYRDDGEEDLSVKRPKKHLLYRMFNPEGSGKEAKPLPEGYGLKNCFIIYKRNITNLLYINLIKIIGNFPLLFAVYALSGAERNACQCRPPSPMPHAKSFRPRSSCVDV